MKNRLHAFGIAQDWISARSCWHLDCWLYAIHNDVYLRAETSIGGTDTIGKQWYRIAEGQAPVAVRVNGTDNLKAISLRYAPWLQNYHWQYLRPIADLWPRGQFKRRSVVFHYALPVAVNEPTEGLQNWYALTGRQERDLAHKARMRQNRT